MRKVCRSPWPQEARGLSSCLRSRGVVGILPPLEGKRKGKGGKTLHKPPHKARKNARRSERPRSSSSIR